MSVFNSWGWTSEHAQYSNSSPLFVFLMVFSFAKVYRLNIKMLSLYPKPLEIRIKWPPFCSDFQWVGFRMVGTKAIAIAIALTDHSKNKPLEILTLKMFGIPMCSVFQCSVFKPLLYIESHLSIVVLWALLSKFLGWNHFN